MSAEKKGGDGFAVPSRFILDSKKRYSTATRLPRTLSLPAQKSFTASVSSGHSASRSRGGRGSRACRSA